MASSPTELTRQEILPMYIHPYKYVLDDLLALAIFFYVTKEVTPFEDDHRIQYIERYNERALLSSGKKILFGMASEHEPPYSWKFNQGEALESVLEWLGLIDIIEKLDESHTLRVILEKPTMSVYSQTFLALLEAQDRLPNSHLSYQMISELGKQAIDEALTYKQVAEAVKELPMTADYSIKGHKVIDLHSVSSIPELAFTDSYCFTFLINRLLELFPSMALLITPSENTHPMLYAFKPVFDFSRIENDSAVIEAKRSYCVLRNEIRGLNFEKLIGLTVSA